MFNEGISSNTEKYRFLTGFWPRKELSDYYKMTERCKKSPEQDRIKFFLPYLMPISIKDKIREHYDESLEVFKRVLAERRIVRLI